VDTNLIVAIAASAVAIVTLLVTTAYRARELKERRRGERRAEIKTRLYEFYGPLAAHLDVLRALQRLLAADKPEGFETLGYLLDPYQEYPTEGKKKRVVLNDLDRRLLEEIVGTGMQIEALVLAKAGLAGDGALLFTAAPEGKLLPVPVAGESPFTAVLAHFRLLRLAYNGRFEGEPEDYRDFGYPRGFEEHIRDKMQALQLELERLGK
jgi:hypothetical protein